MEQWNNRRIVFLVFAMYFLTGAACIVVGSSLPQLVEMYHMELDRIVLFSSAYAFGRVSTVYISGRIVEKAGPLRVLAVGASLVALFLFGIPTIINYYAGLVFAFLGGAGMGTQDAVCPLLLSSVFKNNYAGAMSAGQAFFGMGNFATPFLVGLMLSGKIPFYYSYYILLLVPFAILVCIPFTRFEQADKDLEDQQVIPLYVKKRTFAYGALLIVCMSYSAAANALITYTSSFAESIGIPSSTAAFMLTAYNVGCFAGALAFIWILKKVKETVVLIFNHTVALLALAGMILQDKAIIYFAGVAIAGFFLGVLFNVIVTIATRIDHEHISRAGALIGTVGGASDIMTPMITGVLVSYFGVSISFKYAILMLVIAIIFSIILWSCTTEDKQHNMT